MGKLIKSVSEYISEIEVRKMDLGRIHLYRGQSNDHDLLPGIARPKRGFIKSKIETEKMLLREFRARSISHLKFIPQFDLEFLIIAQHYGIPTRLLDWTENALAALYFAVCIEPDSDSAPVVWVSSFMDQNLVINDFDIDIFDEKEIRFLKPNAIVDRITSQSGWFSLHPQSPKNSGWYKVANEVENSDIKFTKLFIDPSAANSIYRTLNDCGINRYSIYGDLDSLGSYLTSKSRNFNLKL